MIIVPSPSKASSADREGRGVLARRQHHRPDRQAVLAGEIEVALVVRRAAEDGAGAVVHQDEVGDVDRQRPVRVERMDRPDAGVEALLLGGLDARLREVPMWRHSAMKAASFGSVSAAALASGWSGARRRSSRRTACRGASCRPRARVSPSGAVRLSSAKRTSRPSERPIQFSCIRRTFSGQRVERCQRLEQLVGIVGDAEEPLGQLALLDRARRSASRGRRSPARWRARSCRPGPS